MNLSDPPVHILWITERFPPLPGGMAESAEREVTALRHRGFFVDVLIIQSSSTVRSVTLKKKARDNGTDIHVMHPDTAGNASQRAWREIFDRHKTLPYHLIMGFGAAFPGYTAVTFSAWLNIPSMISVRGNDFDRDWFEPKKACFVQQALQRADSIASVSSEKAEKIKSLFPDKHIFRAPNGVEQGLWELLPGEQEACKEIRAGLQSESKTILGLFGELKYKKRTAMFLSAVREAGLNDKIALLIAGKLDGETQAILSDPSLAPLHRHLSFRERDTLAALYAACDFIAIPSLFEGFPNVLLESMAAGAIPLVSDAGAMKEVITHRKTGFLFDTLDRQSVGRVVAEAIALPSGEREKMAQAIKDYVRENFCIEKETDILEREIRNLLKGKNGHWADTEQ